MTIGHAVKDTPEPLQGIQLPPRCSLSTVASIQTRAVRFTSLPSADLFPKRRPL